jgi:hypothetical protein
MNNYCITNPPSDYANPEFILNIPNVPGPFGPGPVVPPTETTSPSVKSLLFYIPTSNGPFKHTEIVPIPLSSTVQCAHEVTTIPNNNTPSVPYIPDFKSYLKSGKYKTEVVDFLVMLFPCTDNSYWVNSVFDTDPQKLLPLKKCPLGNGVLYCGDKDSSVCPFLPAKKVKKLNIVYVILMSIVLLILFILMMLVLFSSEGKKIMSN